MFSYKHNTTQHNTTQHTNSYQLIISLFLTTFLFTACAQPAHWQGVQGGSRADGVVRLTFIQPELSEETPSMAEGRAMAARACQKWGYSDAEAFGSSGSKQCVGGPGFWTMCGKYQVTVEFQCVGGQALRVPQSYPQGQGFY